MSYKQTTPPDDFPGTIYSHGLALEHHIVWWEETGEVPNSNEVIHHVNGDMHDNRFENLEKMSRDEHSRLHADEGRARLLIQCHTCDEVFEVEERHKKKFCSVECYRTYQGDTTTLDTDVVEQFVA